jgi:hypothetical protein
MLLLPGLVLVAGSVSMKRGGAQRLKIATDESLNVTVLNVILISKS